MRVIYIQIHNSSVFAIIVITITVARVIALVKLIVTSQQSKSNNKEKEIELLSRWLQIKFYLYQSLTVFVKNCFYWKSLDVWSFFNPFSAKVTISMYVLIMSRTRFRVNPHSIFGWMSRNSLLETGVISEV